MNLKLVLVLYFMSIIINLICGLGLFLKMQSVTFKPINCYYGLDWQDAVKSGGLTIDK
jgi:hypothetical protein